MPGALWKRIGRGLRQLRRAMAKVIAPRGPEPDPSWDVPIDLSLRGAEALRHLLPVDEEAYLFVAGPAWADCRAYVLYTALDEVQKAAMHLMRLRELLEGPAVSPSDDRISRLLFSHVLEQESARERRLIEVLTVLVLSQTTDEQGYYRDLLLLEDVDGLLSVNGDLKELYGARSGNIESSIDRNIESVRRVEQTIDLAKCWYRANKRPLKDRKQLRPGGLLSSARSRLRAALPRMTDHERLVVGFSYAGYGQASESIHYSTNPREYRLRPGQERGKALTIGLLNLAILERCHRILGQPEVPIMRQLSEALHRTQPTQRVHQQTAGDISVGDFVLAYGDLAEVLDVRQTAYGYRSYKVAYLAEKPLPGIHEDWFPAYYVQLFYTRSQFIERLAEMADEGLMPREIADHIRGPDGARLQPALRASLIQTWKHGLRDWVRNRQRATR